MVSVFFLEKNWNFFQINIKNKEFGLVLSKRSELLCYFVFYPQMPHIAGMNYSRQGSVPLAYTHTSYSGSFEIGLQ